MKYDFPAKLSPFLSLKRNIRAGEMAQCLRALAALAKDTSSIPFNTEPQTERFFMRKTVQLNANTERQDCLLPV